MMEWGTFSVYSLHLQSTPCFVRHCSQLAQCLSYHGVPLCNHHRSWYSGTNVDHTSSLTCACGADAVGFHPDSIQNIDWVNYTPEIIDPIPDTDFLHPLLCTECNKQDRIGLVISERSVRVIRGDPQDERDVIFFTFRNLVKTKFASVKKVNIRPFINPTIYEYDDLHRAFMAWKLNIRIPMSLYWGSVNNEWPSFTVAVAQVMKKRIDANAEHAVQPQLPTELWIKMMQMLSPKDRFQLGKCNKELYAIFRNFHPLKEFLQRELMEGYLDDISMHRLHKLHLIDKYATWYTYDCGVSIDIIIDKIIDKYITLEGFIASYVPTVFREGNLQLNLEGHSCDNCDDSEDDEDDE